MKKARVGDIEMDTNIDFIEATTHLPFERKKWSKNCAMCDIPSKQITVSNVCGYHVKDMLISSLKYKWCSLVLLLHFMSLMKSEIVWFLFITKGS